MNTTEAFVGLTCRDCGASVDAETGAHRCPECGGALDPTYDYERLNLARETFGDRRFESMWRYEELLPFDGDAAVTAGEGATQLVAAPSLAETMGVGHVLIKDEGRNPTGTVADRGLSVAVTAASQHGAETIALATTGNSGQSASAYASVAGLDSEVFVPSRTGFTNKAMINVHGGEMSVVEGRIGDAIANFEDEYGRNEEWYPARPFQTPYRHEGKKTLLYEIVEQLGWTVPDAVVYPTGEGAALVGAYKGASELHDLGLTDDVPALYAAQAEGCAPIVRAIEENRSIPEPWQQPDTICGGIEIPDPRAGEWLLEAIRETDGGAVSTDDEAILDAGIEIAQSVGLELSPSAAASVSGALELAERGAFDEGDTVVLVNTAAGNKESDVLRSHLMRKGI
ncbi:Threonine synthase and cysteate synthase [Halanaeroarchaeum sp. HSR-CO]|uniref:threonine synthase n=1 Tax=Halanaeroarchaeum sp. HSR-CO TaxID=2866382 RepID=UPI00217E41B2|nr:threonine synthase [Halanaeroarchaeum sp. HSR-CO]UWG47461.1 Threonine synthase and cysteate synthase [Halanaeroarchaeum sp. HSR-CO]